MESPPVIVVAFDGSADARRAARWAGAVARAVPGTTVHLVHAVELPPLSFPAPGMTVDDLVRKTDAAARALLDDAARELAAAGTAVATHARHWLPAETTLEAARELGAELVVVGQRGTRGSRLLLGSVSSAVARAAPTPTVVVRGERAAMPPAKVLLAVDGSPASLGAAAAACRWCAGASFVAVRVRDDGAGADPAVLRRDLEAAGLPSERLTSRVLDGPVAETLLDLLEQERFDLVAAGRRGLSAWRELLLGGVSEKLLQLAPCPVLLAH